MTVAPIPRDETCVIILFSIHFVLKAEQLLKKASLAHDVIPVPRQISSDCGMALAFSCRDGALVVKLLSEAAIRIAGLYQRQETGSYVCLDLPDGVN